MDSFLSAIKFYAEREPNSPAILGVTRSYSYSVLDLLTDNISAKLYSRGIREDDRVAILSPHSEDFVLVILALWKLGAVPVPLDFKLPQGDIENLVNFSRVKAVLIHNDFAEHFAAAGNSLYFPFGYSFDNPVPAKINYNEDKTALIIFTSGTIGSPKGVMHTFKSLINSCRAANSLLNAQPWDRCLLSLPLYHIGGFSIILRALYFGAAAAFPKDISTDEIIRSLLNFKPTHISLVPTQLKRILENEIQAYPEIKNLLIGGGPASDDIIIEACKKNWPVNKVYGSSETAAFVTALEKEETINRPASSGKALPDVEIKIFREDASSLSGEVLIKSPALFAGYLFNAAETEEKLRDGFYRTGDIGYIDSEGYLFIETRRTDLIISGGENINPVEVEELIIKHPSVEEICVTGINDAEWGQAVAAVIVLKPNKTIEAEEVKNFMAGKAAAYKIPKKVFIAESLPRTSLGKIKRSEVMNKYNNR